MAEGRAEGNRIEGNRAEDRAESTESSTVDVSGYIDYIQGDIPLILSFPHGGSLKPTEFKDRPGAGRIDKNTLELSEMLLESFQAVGKTPWLIRNKLHRSKMDPNRMPDKNTGVTTRRAYDRYHYSLTDACLKIGKSPGLLLDIHGHNHNHNLIELGYLVPKEVIWYEESWQISSIGRMYERGVGKGESAGSSILELLHGKYSLGNLLGDKGYPAFPGSDYPPEEYNYMFEAPTEPEFPYFRGGFITKLYSQLIDSIQIELNLKGIRDNSKSLKAFAEVFPSVVLEFMQRNGIGT